MMLKMRQTITINWNNRFFLRGLILMILLIAATVSEAKSQNNALGLSDIKGLFDTHKHTSQKYSGNSSKPKNELEFLMASGFNVYKAFFSSQDNPSCVFYPSCSEYSVQSFQQKGLFLGTLYTFDRLSRCHHFISSGQYVFDPSKERFYDPVR